jgi:hypothetical protein
MVTSVRFAKLIVFAGIAFMSYSSAQTCPLNDMSVKVTSEVETVKAIESDAGLVTFSAHIVLRISNSSVSSVLVLADEPVIVGESLSQSREDALSCRYLYDTSYLPSVDKNPKWQNLRLQLDRTDPPEALVRTIPPGGTWKFEKDVAFAIGKTTGKFSNGNESLDEIRSHEPVWLQVYLLMWPNNLEQNMLDPKFGKRLRDRWKVKGHLIIDNLATEPVQIRLPTE